MGNDMEEIVERPEDTSGTCQTCNNTGVVDGELCPDCEGTCVGT